MRHVGTYVVLYDFILEALFLTLFEVKVDSLDLGNEERENC